MVAQTVVIVMDVIVFYYFVFVMSFYLHKFNNKSHTNK